MLLREAARPDCRFPVRRLVISSGGGFVPDNEERRQLLAYDGSTEAMRTLLRANFHDPSWAEDDDYVKRRVEASLAPGAWEAVAAARLKPATCSTLRRRLRSTASSARSSPVPRHPCSIATGVPVDLLDMGLVKDLRLEGGTAYVTVPRLKEFRIRWTVPD